MFPQNICCVLESKSPTQFECQNQKRIPLQLQCDGFDHCGDNSDEPESCKLGKLRRDLFDHILIVLIVTYSLETRDIRPTLVLAHTELLFPENRTLSGYAGGHHSFSRQHRRSCVPHFGHRHHVVPHGKLGA